MAYDFNTIGNTMRQSTAAYDATGKAWLMDYQVALTLKSRNAKTGPIPVSTTSAATCPTACPFNSGGGCYAAFGPLKIFWDKVTSLAAGMSWKAFLAAVKALPEGTLWRHNQAGDLPGPANVIDLHAMSDLVKANSGKRGFTYTHKPTSIVENRLAIEYANRNGFTVNLSGNNLTHADTLADLGIGPVVAVVPHDVTQNTTTPKGRKVVICPATQRDDVSCMTCKLCAVATRDFIVGFPAHGPAKRKASSHV